MRGKKLSLEKAKEYTDNLAVAEERTVEVEGYGPVDEHEAIVNVTDNRVAAIPTEKYQLVGHRTFFKASLEAIEELGFEVARVELMDARERVDMEVIPDLSQDFDGEDVAMGVRFSNSIDASVAARIQAYGFRLVCRNGMLGRTLFGGESMVHIGENVQVSRVAEEVEEIVPLARENLAEIVSKALGTEVIHAEAALESAGFGGGYQEEIAERFAGDSRWDLYCTATEIVEHEHSDVTETTRENLHRTANQLLPTA